MSVMQDEERCPSCHGSTESPGALCPPCQEALDEVMACPDCGGSTPDPGMRCPPCQEAFDEARADAERD